MTVMQAVAEEVAARGCTIVADQTFILATRDTGYRDVSAAVAELIDNSLQASARLIQVFVREDRIVPARNVTIGVLDDGQGMTADTLREALRFGGTERFGDRSGLGRFGMGLPNSSVSQTRRFDVFTWQRPGDCIHTYLDVDEVAAGRMRSVPHPNLHQLPEWVAPYVSASGTLVLWTKCDRLARHRASTIAQRLREPLGRLYRYAIWSGVRLTINGVPVKAVDPLFLRGDSQLRRGTLFGPPLKYEFATSGGSSVVEVRFSELPVGEWHAWPVEEKRRAGIVGGAGVSIVRAGREIDYGWYLMGSKRQNYDDWWRCEIRFTPELDELFGVTHSKQGITPSAELRTTLGPDLEKVARSLNSRVRSAFERIKAEAPSMAASQATARDEFLPPLRVPTGAVRTGGLRYRIEARPLRGPEFYNASLCDNTVLVVLNQDHPFFTHLYQPALTDPTGRELQRLECLILAAARAELDIQRDRERLWVDRMRRAWGDALAVFLDS